MSYRDVADAIGLTERAVRYIENGQRDPSWGTAQKLAELFNTSTDELLVQDCNTDSSYSSAMEQAATKDTALGVMGMDEQRVREIVRE